jgi:hypothetical protein
VRKSQKRLLPKKVNSAERDEARKALGERTTEFGQFRKLREEDLLKLSVAERALYDNQQALAKMNEDSAAKDKAASEARVDAAIKSKAGTNEKLAVRMKEMWGVIGVEAITPEQIEQKTAMVLGAISTTQPDLVATVSGFSGGYQPPQAVAKDGETFADTKAGQAAAKDLGLILEPPAAK